MYYKKSLFNAKMSACIDKGNIWYRKDNANTYQFIKQNHYACMEIELNNGTTFMNIAIFILKSQCGLQHEVKSFT